MNFEDSLKTRQEIRRVQKNVSELTPREKALRKLLEKGQIHLRESVMREFANFPERFDEIESQVISDKIKSCRKCRQRYEEITPSLLEQVS